MKEKIQGYQESEMGYKSIKELLESYHDKIMKADELEAQWIAQVNQANLLSDQRSTSTFYSSDKPKGIYPQDI